MANVERDEVLEYNGELKEGLTEMWNAINQGQQKKMIREHPRVAALLDRFGIAHE